MFRIFITVNFVYVLLITFNLTRGLLDSNSSDIQDLLDNFANPENGTDLFQSNLSEIFQSSIDNNTNDELVLKKNLYIFPVNAPNLVISQKHEIHAIPVENATNSTDEQPVTELQEINEIGLSKLLPVNLSQDANSDGFLQKNLNVSNPQSFEIISGYKPESGLITKEIPLPKTVSESITLPQNSISKLLSTLKDANTEEETTQVPETVKREAESKSEPSQMKRTDFSSTASYNDETPLGGVDGFKLRMLVPEEDNKNEQDLDVAEDIVFRPLFRYRQEARLRPQYNDEPVYRSSFNRRRNRYRYNNYDNYYSRYRYRPRSRSDDYNQDYNQN